MFVIHVIFVIRCVFVFQYYFELELNNIIYIMSALGFYTLG